MNRTWLISDMHLGDQRIALWGPRPTDWEERLRRNLQRVLAPGDRLIDLGDSYVGPSSRALEVLSGLIPAGVMVDHIEGNHDRLSNAHLAALGWRSHQALVVSGLYLSHHGTRNLPDDARGQVYGHYHSNPGNPELSHGLRFSLEERQLQPVLLTAIQREMEKRKLLRNLPERADDRWFLRGMAPQHPWSVDSRVQDPDSGLLGTVTHSEVNRCSVLWDGTLPEGAPRRCHGGAPLPGQSEGMTPERANQLQEIGGDRQEDGGDRWHDKSQTAEEDREHPNPEPSS